MRDHSILTDAIHTASQASRVYLRGMSIHTATGEASCVYSISRIQQPHAIHWLKTLSDGRDKML